MNPPIANPTTEVLLSQMSWVRSLARSLVDDPHAADDLCQETYLAALESPPANHRSPRGWLRVVLRNFLLQDARGDERRRRREEYAARREVTSATSELVERVAVQKQVAEAVLELEEPYRSTIILRYFEELPPRKIAARTEVPVSTVKTRLDRGLKQLRDKLTRVHGERGTWMLALLPLTTKPASPVLITLGAVLMNSKLKLAIVALIVILAGILTWNGFSGDDPRTPSGGAAAALPDASDDATGARGARSGSTAGGGGASPARSAKPLASPMTDANEEPEIVTIPGRVIDVLAQPAAGV